MTAAAFVRPAFLWATVVAGVSLFAQTPVPTPRPIDALLELPRLDPDVRVASLKRVSTPIPEVMDAVTGMTRLTVDYDRNVPELNKTCSVNLVNASLQEVLDAVLRANGIAFTVLLPKSVLVYSDTAANRDKYGWAVRAFDIMHADPNELAALMNRQFLSRPGFRPIIVVGQRPSRVITARAIGEQMAVIAKLIADNDKH